MIQKSCVVKGSGGKSRTPPKIDMPIGGGDAFGFRAALGFRAGFFLAMKSGRIFSSYLVWRSCISPGP